MINESKLSLKVWMDKLSPYYQTATIKKYYRMNKGSENKLYKILLSQHSKKSDEKQFLLKLNSIRLKRSVREYGKLFQGEHDERGTIRKITDVKRNGGNYEISKDGDDVQITLKPKSKNNIVTLYIEFGDMEQKKFKDFFKDIDHYFIYAKSDKDIIELEKILQTYFIKVLEIKALKESIKKDSIYEEEEALKDILHKVNRLLYIAGNELYKTLPKEIKIKTIKELTAETKVKLEELDLKLDTPYTYSGLLEKLRKI